MSVFSGGVARSTRAGIPFGASIPAIETAENTSTSIFVSNEHVTPA